MALWHDRRGRFSPLRAATLIVLVAPLLALAYFTATHALGARPRTEAIHEMGLWAFRFLLLALFVTPLRRIARNQTIKSRDRETCVTKIKQKEQKNPGISAARQRESLLPFAALGELRTSLPPTFPCTGHRRRKWRSWCWGRCST